MSFVYRLIRISMQRRVTRNIQAKLFAVGLKRDVFPEQLLYSGELHFRSNLLHLRWCLVHRLGIRETWVSIGPGNPYHLTQSRTSRSE